MNTKDRFKSRKLIICGILFVASTVFLSIGMATFAEWSDFNIWNFGAYTIGNGVEHYTKKGDE